MNHIGTKSIETERLLLRKWDINDIEDVFCFCGDNTVVPFPHENIIETKNWLEKMIKSYDEINTYEWGIELKNINKIIGMIYVTENDDVNQSCNIVCTLSKNYWNNGYATEALYSVVRYLINDAGFNRVECEHFIDNHASEKVMEKAGMKYEGTLRQSSINWKTGKFTDVKIYSTIKGDLNK